MRRTILLLAVVLAVAVTSGATAAYVVHTADIANGAVTHPKLSNNSVWHANLGTSVVRFPNVAPGAIASDNLGFDVDTHLAMWFTTAPGGAIVFQSGAIKQASGDEYTLPVAGNLQDCAILATGQAPEQIGAAPDAQVPNQVDVTPSNPQVGFSVAVYCDGRAAGASAYESQDGQ